MSAHLDLSRNDCIVMELSYCTDSLFPKYGQALFDQLRRCYPDVQWELTYCPDLPRDLDIDTVDEDELERVSRAVDVPLEKYLLENWTRHDDEFDLHYTGARNLRVALAVTHPRQGGTRVQRKYMGRPFTRHARLEIKWHHDDFERGHEEHTMGMIDALGAAFEASYAYVCHGKQWRYWALNCKLMGVFWVTYLGPEFYPGKEAVDHVKKHCARVHESDSGSLCMQLTDEFHESLHVANRMRARKVATILGRLG